MKVGFIGLGHMGAHMAHNLNKAGHEVTVFDVRPEAVDALVARTPGLKAGRSVAEAARDADFVGTSLPGPTEVEEIVLGPGGLRDSMKSGSIFIDHSSNSPATVRKLAAALADKGVSMLDAPVSGGERGSEAGTLSVMVGGEERIWDKAQPHLQAIGNKLFHCGPIGTGAAVKLCNNAAAHAYMAVVGEVLTLGMTAGVNLKTLTSVIGVSSGRSPTLTNAFPSRVFRRQFTGFGFTAALAAKDLRLAAEMAHDLGLQVGCIETTAADLQEALDMGLGAQDMNAIAQVYEKRTGQVMQLPEADLEELKKLFSA